MTHSWFVNVVVEYDSGLNPNYLTKEALKCIDISCKEVVELYESDTAMRLEISDKNKWNILEKKAGMLEAYIYRKYIESIRICDISISEEYRDDKIRMEDVCFEGLQAICKMYYKNGPSEMINENASRCPICYEKKEEQLMINCGHIICASCACRMEYRQKCPICMKEIEYAKKLYFCI